MAIPDSIGAGMAELLHGVFFYEIVARFGAISWMNRLIRRKTVSAVAMGCLFALLGAQQARWLGYEELFPGSLRFTYTCLQLSIEVVLGLFFVRWGLWSASLTHGVMGLQGILLPLTLGRIS